MLPVASTANTPPVVGTLDELAELGALELGTLELERTELGTDDELGRLEELPILEELPMLDGEVQLAVKPNGEGWLAQVALEIQLLLFS
jgi:hypothetical protein